MNHRNIQNQSHCRKQEQYKKDYNSMNKVSKTLIKFKLKKKKELPLSSLVIQGQKGENKLILSHRLPTYSFIFPSKLISFSLPN